MSQLHSQSQSQSQTQSQSHSHGQRGSISQHSRSASQYLSSEVDELSDRELVKKVSDLKNHLKSLNLENEIFERTILRLEPALMNGVQQALEYAFKLHRSSASSINTGSYAKSQSKVGLGFGELSSPSRSRLLASPSRISTRRMESSAKISGTIIYGTGPKINVLERAEIVTAEMEFIIRTLEKARKKAAKQHALLKAQLEEIGLRVGDIKRATEMFNQQVIIEGWDKIAQRIPAEIWIRNMTEWVKICDSQIGKLRLRTSTLNTQFSKLKGQIKIKAELSEALRPVDFEKLEIENKVCEEIIETKLKHLKELKELTGEANLNLTIHKKAMWVQNAYLDNVLELIKTKKRLTIELGQEEIVIGAQAEELEKEYKEIKKVRMAYEVPNIMDYVAVKSEMTELQHSVKLLENRLHVQQIALRSLNMKLLSIFFN